MKNDTVAKTISILLLTASMSLACEPVGSAHVCKSEQTNLNPVDEILAQLKQATTELQSYQGQIEYLFKQPLLESQTLRKGVLYCKKSNGRSKLRINFQTLRQDDEEEQKYKEHFILDGTWLTHIDYQIKSAERRQLAEPNEPTDAFDLAGRNFPIIGFTKVDELKKQFDIELVESTVNASEDLIQLHLKVRPDSIYKDDYTSIDFWIDKKLTLPTKVTAISTEEDIYEIRLLSPKVNNKIRDEVFRFRIPEDFTIEEILLDKQNSGK